MKEEMNYKVYMHTNILNGKIYIGITKQKPERRWRNGNGYKDGHFKNAIQKYGWGNFKHLVLFDRLTQQEAENIEIELIAYFQSNKREYGYNDQNGGNTTGTHSEETKKKLSEINKGKHVGEKNYFYGKKYSGELNHNYGKHLSEEQKRKISQTRKERKIQAWNKGLKNCFSEETRKKISEGNKKYNLLHPNRQNGKNNPNAKGCICLDTHEIFDTITEASKKYNLQVSHVSACCHKKQKSTKGFHFMFLEDYLKKEVNND